MQKITRHFRTTLTIAIFILAISATGATAATFTVTNINDDGTGSLREAITQANSNAQADTINFDAAFFNVPRTITLTSGELRITRDDSTGFNLGRLLTVNGPGANLLTISGNNASRVFFVSLYANLAMSGITVRDGNGVGTILNSEGISGGGMLADRAVVSLSNVTFRNNSAAGSGGGLYLSALKSLTITDSLVTENHANVSGGGFIDYDGDIKVIRNTTISNNSAVNNVGGAFIRRGMITMENCLITGNKAGLTGAPGGGGNSGGLNFFQADGTVTDTVISNNSAGL